MGRDDLYCLAHPHLKKQNNDTLRGKRDFSIGAVKQAEKLPRGQPVEARGPFNLLEAVLKGTAPPERAA